MAKMPDIKLPVWVSIGDQPARKIGTIYVPVRVEGTTISFDIDKVDMAEYIATMLETEAQRVRECGNAEPS